MMIIIVKALLSPVYGPIVNSNSLPIGEDTGTAEYGSLCSRPCFVGQVFEHFYLSLPEQRRCSRISPDLVPLGARQVLHNDAVVGVGVQAGRPCPQGWGSMPVDREVQLFSGVRRDLAEDINDDFLRSVRGSRPLGGSIAFVKLQGFPFVAQHFLFAVFQLESGRSPRRESSPPPVSPGRL